MAKQNRSGVAANRLVNDPSLNATKHGCRSRTRLLPWESQADYDRVAKTWCDHFHPTSNAELELVTQVVDAQWRLLRAERAFDDCQFALSTESPNSSQWPAEPTRHLLLLQRYRTTEHNNFRRAMRDVELFQKAAKENVKYTESLIEMACQDANLPPAQKDLKKRIVRTMYTPVVVPKDRKDGGCQCEICLWTWGIAHGPDTPPLPQADAPPPLQG